MRQSKTPDLTSLRGELPHEETEIGVMGSGEEDGVYERVPEEISHVPVRADHPPGSAAPRLGDCTGGSTDGKCDWSGSVDGL